MYEHLNLCRTCVLIVICLLDMQELHKCQKPDGINIVRSHYVSTELGLYRSWSPIPTLRKQIHIIYRVFSALEAEKKLSLETKIFFHIFAQYNYCGYTLEPFHRLYQQSVFWSKHRKKNINPMYMYTPFSPYESGVLSSGFSLQFCTVISRLCRDETEMSRPMGKPTICICENKDAEADQRLCFRYLDSTIPLQLKSEISSF